MAVTWIGATASCNLKVNYDSAQDKINQILTALQNNNCDTSCIDSLIAQVDSMVNGALSTIQSITDKITNVVNCITTVDPDTHLQALQNMSKTMNDITSGKPLTDALIKLDNILDGIADKTCDDITSAVNDLTNDVASLENSISNVSASISATVDAETSLTSGTSKVASLINCVSDALKNDQNGMAANLEMVDTNLAGVATQVQASLQAGTNGQDILAQAKAQLSVNLDINGKYDDLNNSMSNLF